jgi:hypothetical protein
MAQPQAPPRRTAPPWAVAVGSLVICTHLGLVLTNVLAAPSGPWLGSPDGGMSPPPQFAATVNEHTAPTYLRFLKLTHNYHFFTNRPALPAVEVEFRVRNVRGEESVVRLPDPEANPWVRHRQALLARALAGDIPAPPPAGETVAAPGEQMRTVQIWDMVENRGLKLNRVPAHLVPRDRPVSVPSDWSLVLAESYARHLLRDRDAVSVEVIRRTREPITPGVLFGPEPPAGAFDELVATFGEMKR